MEMLPMKTTKGRLHTEKLSDLLQEGKDLRILKSASHPTNSPRILKESFPSTFSLILQQNGIDII